MANFYEDGPGAPAFLKIQNAAKRIDGSAEDITALARDHEIEIVVVAGEPRVVAVSLDRFIRRARARAKQSVAQGGE